MLIPRNQNTDMPTWSTVSAMVGRLFITYALNAGLQLQFEVFPTPLRAQGSAVASACVMICQLFIPYIVHSVRRRLRADRDV